MRIITRSTAALLGGAALAAAALFAPGFNGAPAQAEELTSSCEVTGGTLEWGVREAFRSYISGSIANGGWEVSDGASYETPSFSWSNPVGSIDAETGEGSVSFTGAISFSGHDGVLNLRFANPTIEFRGDGTAKLLLDARSNDAQGELVIDETRVPVGRIDGVGAIDPASGAVSFDEAPAILTADGARAFAGFYATGEDLDPITLSLDFAACAGGSGGTGGGPAATADPAEPEVTADIAEAPAGGGIPWLPISIGGLAVVVIAVTVGLLIAGQKRGDGADDAADGASGTE